LSENTGVELTVSLVIYNSDRNMIDRLIKSLLNSSVSFRLYIVDNSEAPTRIGNPCEKIEYLQNPLGNVGFGRGHNFAIANSTLAPFHLVVNPDVYFEEGTLESLLAFMKINQDVVLVSPKVRFPGGELQYLCKRYPTLLALFGRRFLPNRFKYMLEKYISYNEMRESGYNSTMDVEFISGCFMLFRKPELIGCGMFDKKIFLHFEDADLSWRMKNFGRTVFYPGATVFHEWGRGSHKSWRMTLITIRSAVYFFNKHGWKIY
jgi:GT2 family glycosyltransferase